MNSLDKHLLPVLGDRSGSPASSRPTSRPCAPRCRSWRRRWASCTSISASSWRRLSMTVPRSQSAVREPGCRASGRKAQPVRSKSWSGSTTRSPSGSRLRCRSVGVGLRQGEASGLSVDRVDFLRRTLRVDRQLVDRNLAEPVLAPPKTASSHRTVPLAGFVVEALSVHLAQFPREPGRLVLAHPARLPVASAPVRPPVAPCGESRGRARVRYHDLRHRSPRRCCRVPGVSVKAVADWFLGHASPTITLTTYRAPDACRRGRRPHGARRRARSSG